MSALARFTASELLGSAQLRHRVSFEDSLKEGGESMGLSYATFSDPDGNSWLFQETTTRLPGTTDARTTTYESVKDLPRALCRAAVAQGPD
jgi:hypothetical protein